MYFGASKQIGVRRLADWWSTNRFALAESARCYSALLKIGPVTMVVMLSRCCRTLREIVLIDSIQTTATSTSRLKSLFAKAFNHAPEISFRNRVNNGGNG